MTDPKPATPATEPVCEWCGAYKSRHMDAYYYGFSATESSEVDRILCSVARAGKGCHHTESWTEYGYVEKIQDAAIACAARIAADAETIKDLKCDLEEARDFSRMQTKALENRNEEIQAKDEEIERLTSEAVSVGHAEDRAMKAEARLATLRDQVRVLREALVRLRDCDWTISLPDRMDAVRDIARTALATVEPKG